MGVLQWESVRDAHSVSCNKQSFVIYDLKEWMFQTKNVAFFYIKINHRYGVGNNIRIFQASTTEIEQLARI